MKVQGCGMDIPCYVCRDREEPRDQAQCGAVVRNLSFESRRSDVARSGVDRTKGTRLLVELFVVCDMFGGI